MIYRVILVAILLLLVLRAIRLLVRGITQAAGPAPPHRRPSTPVKLVRDPICGTHVSPATSLSLTASGATHYFCSEECRTKYRRH